MDQTSALNQLEEFLRQPDAVMEPNIVSKLRQYVTRGGNPRDVVEMLTESYVGYAQMSSLVSTWTRELCEINEDQSSYTSEALLLRDLIKKRFDPSKFAGVFTRGGGGPPRWLDGLSSDKDGRHLIYDLSAKHHNCLLLNYAIQKILRQGYENEVALIGSSLASYFGVFHRLAANRIKEIAIASPARLRQLSNELKETCCQGQHTYLNAQQLLTHFGQHENGSRYRRVSEELEQFAAGKKGPIVWRMRNLFLPLQEHGECAACITDLLSIGAVNVVKPGVVETIAKLETMYSREDSPSIKLIRHPRVYELLIAALFTPDRQLMLKQRQSISNVLAYATAVSALGVSAKPEADAVKEMAACLLVGAQVARIASSGNKLLPADLEIAAMVLKKPAVAQGILFAMKQQTTSAEYWHGSDRGSAASSFLQLLSILVPLVPKLHPQIVDVIGCSLRTMGNARPELARSFIEMAIILVQAGQVMRVIRLIERWASSADPSLVRHFIFNLLIVCAPPLSTEFALSLVRLMMVASVKHTRQHQRSYKDMERVEEFAKYCLKIRFEPDLNAKEKAYLESLRQGS